MSRRMKMIAATSSIIVVVIAVILVIATFVLNRDMRNAMDDIVTPFNALLNYDDEIRLRIFELDRKVEVEGFLMEILPNHLDVNIMQVDVSFEKPASLPSSLLLYVEDLDFHTLFRTIYVNGVQAGIFSIVVPVQ